jgi:hypothetical protein
LSQEDAERKEYLNVAESDIKTSVAEWLFSGNGASVSSGEVLFDRDNARREVNAAKVRARLRACGIVKPGFPVRYEDYADDELDV